MINKYDLKVGQRVKYIFGETTVDFITVRSFNSESNFPSVELSNGHTAIWNGKKYVISDLNYTELLNY